MLQDLLNVLHKLRVKPWEVRNKGKLVQNDLEVRLGHSGGWEQKLRSCGESRAFLFPMSKLHIYEVHVKNVPPPS